METPVTTLRTALPALLLAAGLACAPDLRVDHPFDGAGGLDAGPLVSASVLDGGLTVLHVDATSKTDRTYVDLDQGREMKLEEALASNGWDLAFQRVTIWSNGGATNPAGVVLVAAVKGDFEALTRAPAAGFLADGLTPVLNDAQGGWYTYTLSSHGVNPTPGLLYVVKSSAGAYFKLQVLEYYDSAGTAAVYTLQYAPLAPP